MKTKLNEMVLNIDEKVNPKVGRILHKIFKTITLLLSTIGVAVIAIVFGALALPHSLDSTLPHLDKTLPVIIFSAWLFFVIVSSTLWFYFSKWNV